MSDECKIALMYLKKRIAGLCKQRLEYLGLNDLGVVSLKIGTSVPELKRFLNGHGSLNSLQLNNLATLCSITLSDVLSFIQPNNKTNVKKISSINSKLNEKQKNDILDILDTLDEDNFIKNK